ncbi:MAG: mechanosensitive ion channel family protein [Ruminococcus sp.]|jgi:small conductance mechanosensitive channel|nr:mechanosensitive ion channel family protein [Ruminococcus sp.]
MNLSWVVTQILPIAGRVVFAVVVFIIGFLLNKVILNIISKGIDKVDKTLHTFALTVIKVILLTIVFVIALSMLGIPMTSIVAVIGSAGIAIGLALKDSLSNVAAGVLVLYGKIFKVGDYVEIGGTGGIVVEIGIAYTKLTTIDGKDTYIPNTTVAGSVVINFNSQTKRRVDFNLKLDYSVPTEKAIEIITGVLEADERVIKESHIFVRLTELAPTYQQISARVYVPTEKYWDVNADGLAKIKKAFDDAHLSLFCNRIKVTE